jgi:hypothetical protein
MQNVVQGSADDDVSLAHVKWTVTPSGNLSVDHVTITFECRG